ncbi:hypothetical protein GCM10023195_63880 [Actinoallomurus liliacearum]|uniref:Uncharacterized protein n=1 Tax=Actinoallomurus liliacearum TaxID=1080073 RepID=A0ABP8TRQ6_9ACTN
MPTAARSNPATGTYVSAGQGSLFAFYPSGSERKPQTLKQLQDLWPQEPTADVLGTIHPCWPTFRVSPGVGRTASAASRMPEPELLRYPAHEGDHLYNGPRPPGIPS